MYHGVYQGGYLGCTIGVYHRSVPRDHRVYHRGVPRDHRVYKGYLGVYKGVPRGVQGVPRGVHKVVYTRIYASLGTMVGILPPYYASLLYHPGYTTVYTRPTHYWVHCSTEADVQRGRALGSEGEYPLGESLSGP